MAADVMLDERLERAYVESKVIKTGLDRLATRLDDAEGHLRDDLRACAERFDAYMRDLHDAYAGTDELPRSK